MNEQALKDAYQAFVSQGYNKSIDEFKKLINTNPEALKDSYNVFVSEGYAKSIDDYKKLLGVGMQPQNVEVKKKFALDSSSEVGSSVSQESPEAAKTVSPQLVGSDKRIEKTLGAINTDLMNQTEEDVVSQLSKDQTLKDLGFAFEEAGWTGDYMKVTAPNDKTIEISLDNFLDSKSAKQSLALQNFIKNNTTKEKRAELDKFVAIEEAEEKTLQSEKKKFEDIFDRQLNVKPKTSESKYLNERLSTINTDLINQTEENVVAELQYQFGDLDFKFEPTGITGDYMKVTAPDNKTTIEVSLDNFLDSKSKRESDKLKKFIQDNAPAKGLFVLENTAKYQDKKFNSEKQVQDVTKNLSDEFNKLNSKQKQFLAKKAQFEKQTEELKDLPQDSEEFKVKYAQLESQQAALQSELKTLLDEEDTIAYKKRKLDKEVGNYTIMRSKQGGAFGGVQNALAKFPGTMAALYTSIMTDIHGSFAPIVRDDSLLSQFIPALYTNEEATKLAIEGAKKLGLNPPKDMSQESINKFKASLTEDQLEEIEDYIRDQSKKEAKKEMLPLMREGFLQLAGDSETTKEWSEEKKKGFWGGALLGTVESIPAIMGGWQQRTVQMYAMVADGLAQEMENDPDFEDVTENEKLAITLPIGIVGAVLENVGLRNLKQSKGLISSITLSVLGKSGRGVTAKTFRELVENEVESRIAKGLLIVSAAGAAEFETGAAQEATELLGKEIFNAVKDKELFKNPKSVEDWIENIAVSGAQEAVGGFVLGTPSAVSAAFTQKGFLKMDDLTFQTFANMANDEKLQSAYITSLKDKITRGILTTAEAKNQLNNYRNSVGLFRQLPEGLSTQQQKEAMNLLKEKRDLENFVEGKDPALVVKAKNRINEINDSLTKLTETDAVQEQSTTEIPVQSETGISETMEEGIPQSESEVITEQVTQPQGEVTQTIIEEPTITIADAINDRTGAYVYDGKKGTITTIGQTVVLETDNEIIDLGNVDELNESTLSDFGIIKAEEVLLNDDNSINIGEKKYVNNYSNPEAAISQDKDGNYSVTLDTENGQKRTFRGQQAEQIVYQMKLKNFEQNGTEQQIEQANELADEAIRIEEEIGTPSVEREGKTVRKGKRKQRTLKTIKEPLNKSERNTQEISIIKDKIKLQELSLSEEYGSKARAIIKGEPMVSFFDTYLKAKKDGSNPELVSSVDELLAIDYQAPKKTEGMLPVGTEVEIDGKKGKITSVSNFFGEQEYKVSFDGNRSGSEYIKVKDFNKKGKVINKTKPAETKSEPQAGLGEDIARQVGLPPAPEGFDIVTETAPVVENKPTELTIDEQMAQYIDEAHSYQDEMTAVKKDNSLTEKEKNDKLDELDKKYMQALKKSNALAFEKARTKPAESKTEAAPVAETKPKAESKVDKEIAQLDEAKDLLNLDTKDKDGLNRVLDFLNKIDDSLDMDPNELNDVTRVMAIGTAKAVVKTLKALVKAGITLQEAIKAASEIHSVDYKDVLKAFDVISQGGKQKSAPSPLISDIYAGDGRIISMVKDIKKITMREKDLLVKQIKDKAKGAKDVIKVQKELAKELADEIKELSAKGKITLTQAANIVSKFSKVNLLNETSVSNFVDYMSKVFADAEYDNKVNVAKNKLKAAKKNIVTKLGIADGLILDLQRLFSINPNLIPEQYLDRYLELVDMFSARQQVLTLEEKSVVTKDVQDILDEINNEQSLSYELADRFESSESKVYKDGKLDYSASVNNMLKNEEISQVEADLMKKYKSRIIEKEERAKMTEEEIEAEKQILTNEIKKSTINIDDLPTRNEKDLAKRFSRLIKGDAINQLTNTDLKNVLKLIDNINNGYLPHYTQLMVEKMNSTNKAKPLGNSVDKSKLPTFSYLYSKAKSLLTKKDAVLEMIRRNPLFYIDQVLGDFKTKDVYNSVLEMAAEGEANFTSEFKKVKEKLTKAQNEVAKSFSLNPNKTLKSSFKMMTYAIQLEYESNLGNKEVNPASEYLKATIKHIKDGKSQFQDKDAQVLQDIYDEFVGADGNIDNEKLYNSFNKAEKNAIKTVREVNESLTEKAEYTSAIIRGQKINPLTNYIHLNVLHDSQPTDISSGPAFINDYNNSMRPSTKAKSLIERTGKVSPLNFDIFSSAERGAKFVLMDYNLTEPIRTARKTINKTVSDLEKNGKMSDKNRKVINAINQAVEEAIDNLLLNSYTSTSVVDDAVNYISKQGYRGVLAGTGRFMAEFLSNVGFIIISDPNTFTEGLKHTKLLMSPEAPQVMQNVNSKETNRIFPSDMLSGRLIDTSVLNQSTGVRGAKSKNSALNKLEQIWNLTGKKYKNAVELTADALISTPDKAVMRPIWFGSFANQFEKITGKKVDFKKIAENDSDYMEQNREAIDKAKNIADERSVITGASSNAFSGILKGTSKANHGATVKGFNNFNNFMTRFLIYEYVTARTGIYAAMGNGSLSRRQGAALLGAVTTRMTVYSLLVKALGGGLIGLLDDEEEKKKSIEKQLGQALASTFTSMLLGRDFGNATKTLMNYGVEAVNEKYLDFLRDGEYDPYKDQIQYQNFGNDEKKKGISDFILKMGGSFGPALNTADLIVRKYSEPEKKKEDAIERSEKEKNVRIPLEVLGNLGFIPLYKDIRKSVLKDIYKGLEDANEQSEIKAEEREKEKEKLSGYKNKTEMKKENPALYKEKFGDEEDKKRDSNFGSKKFGSSSGKSSSSFGSKKFGAD